MINYRLRIDHALHEVKKILHEDLKKRLTIFKGASDIAVFKRFDDEALQYTHFHQQR